MRFKLRRTTIPCLIATILVVISIAFVSSHQAAVNQPKHPAGNHQPVILACPDSVVVSAIDAVSRDEEFATAALPPLSVWTDTGSLNTARTSPSATLLKNGKVLVVGGVGNPYSILASAELYDPASETWTPTGSLNKARYRHAAILLPNGKVLVVGGFGPGGQTSAEVYDPVSGVWNPTGNLHSSKAEGAEVPPAAVLLPTGRVLVVGDGGAEIYDPNAETWTITSSPHTKGNVATLLQNGKVLVVSGPFDGAPLSPIDGNPKGGLAELYDPVSDSWSPTGSMNSYHQVYEPTLTLLPNGKVLAVGGQLPWGSAELYDPASGSWTITGYWVSSDFQGVERHYGHTATLLNSGEVLIVGGINFNNSTGSVDLYDPVTGIWRHAAPTSVPRGFHTSTLLGNGEVLVAGGNSATATAELYEGIMISGRVAAGTSGLGNVTMTLTGDTTGSTTTDALGNYSFNVKPGGNYTITPSRTQYSFTPASLFFNGPIGNQTSANFEATATGYTIMARFYSQGTSLQIGLSGITVTLSGPTNATGVTGGGGVYYFNNLQPGGNYTVTATPPNGFKFSPPSRVFTNLGSDAAAEFEKVPIYRVSGRVADTRGNGVANVTMVVGISHDPPVPLLTTTTDAGGNYSFVFDKYDINQHFSQACAVYASKAAYTFSPIFYRTQAGVDIFGISIGSFDRNTPKTVVANFFPTYSISGRVTDANGPLGDVTMVLDGQTASTKTDSNGNYSFSNVIGGNNHTITPSKTNYVFTPAGLTLNALSTNQTGANFMASSLGPEPEVLTTDQVALKTWTYQGRTYAYAKLSFPNDAYHVANWGQTARAGNDFSADAGVERYLGPSVQALTTTAQIYDLGPLPDGNYTFAFKNSGTVVQSVAFTVNAIAQQPNPLDDAREFVRQQYRDFLNREPDQAGEDYWTDNITKCSNPKRRPAGQTEAQCIVRQKEATSAAFFLSPEFQYTGYFVHTFYQGALGRPPKLSEFLPDAQAIAAGIIVDGKLSVEKINQNRTDFVAEFANCTDPAKYRCAEFKARYDGLSNQEYVDKLFLNTGVDNTIERAAYIDRLNAGTESRSSVLWRIVNASNVLAEGSQSWSSGSGYAFYLAQLNPAFVEMEYFGYLRRDPDGAGYAHWLNKLNQYGGNWVNAELVLSFISSPEYRARFGQP